MIDPSIFCDPEFFSCSFIIESQVLLEMNNGRAKWETRQSSAQGIIQPITGKERELLPEGDIQKEGITVYTTSTLSLGSEMARASILVFKGKKYMIKSLEEWGFGIERYYKAIALIIEDKVE